MRRIVCLVLPTAALAIRVAPAVLLAFALLLYHGPAGSPALHDSSVQAATTNTLFAPAVFTSFPAASPQVDIQNFSFRPQVVTVTVGSLVRWTEFDGQPGQTRGIHNVVSTTGAWTAVPCKQSTDPCIRYGETFLVTFDTPGTYSYFCDPHASFMRGTIVVQPLPGAVTTTAASGAR
jgi:plastocyanin